MQRVHECIRYERGQLIEIAIKCKYDNHYKIINKDICVKIREYRLNRRYKRGGNRLKTTFRKITKQHNTLNINNLINISCDDRGSNSNRDNIWIALINAQFLRSKELLLYDYIRENNIKMCIVTETWLQNRDEDKAWCDTSAFNSDNLVLHNINWEAHRGGDITLITKSNLTITFLVIDKPSSLEAAKWRVSLPGMNIALIVIYRPPYSINHPVTIAMFIDEFTKWIADQLTSDGNIFLLGDFNMQINRIDTDVDIKMFIDTMEALGIQQWVDFGTHHLGNTIDIVFTELASKLEMLSCTPCPFVSDHYVVNVKQKYKKR